MKKIIDCSLEYPASMPEIAVKFVKNILKKNPDQRQSINQLLKHPLLQVTQTSQSLFWSLFITTFLNSFALWMIKSFNQINKPKNIPKKQLNEILWNSHISINQATHVHLSTHIPHVFRWESLMYPSSPHPVPQAFFSFQYYEVAPTKYASKLTFRVWSQDVKMPLL